MVFGPFGFFGLVMAFALKFLSFIPATRFTEKQTSRLLMLYPLSVR